MVFIARPNTLRSLVLALALTLALTMLLSACKGDRGNDGGVLGLFTWSGDVVSVDMSNFGVTSTGNHPASGVVQQLTTMSATSGTLVALNVVVQANPAETTEFLFFDVDVEDGEEKTLLFDFTGDQLTVSELAQTLTGAAF